MDYDIISPLLTAFALSTISGLALGCVLSAFGRIKRVASADFR